MNNPNISNHKIIKNLKLLGIKNPLNWGIKNYLTFTGNNLKRIQVILKKQNN